MNESRNNFIGTIFARNSTTTPSFSLEICSAGLCCSVGYNLEAAACAIRANMDHFQQSDFETLQHERILVARIDEDELWGQARIAQWIALAIDDCLNSVQTKNFEKVPLIWLAPEPERSSTDEDWYTDTFAKAIDQLDLDFHPCSGVMPLGRAGLAEALIRAHSLLDLPDCDHVLLVGADTYLNAATLNSYLQKERLQVRGNTDGFIPGEAAAAILLRKAVIGASKVDSTAKCAPKVYITGLGIGDEPGRWDGSVPSKSQGLTKAIRSALKMSCIDYNALRFRVSDQNGESFFTRDATNALTRVTPSGGNALSLLTLADCIGEVGAATGPAMLAYISKIIASPSNLQEYGLIHLANDNGLRCAVILRLTD